MVRVVPGYLGSPTQQYENEEHSRSQCEPLKRISLMDGDPRFKPAPFARETTGVAFWAQ
jgi:hypothetical protein